MHISGETAVAKGYITQPQRQPGSVKEGSVDLTVGAVIIKNEKGKDYETENATLEPQQTAVLICSEYFNLPEGILAQALLKNRLSEKGLFAFNTGIIDSNYNGPIATLVTNFSNQNIDIENQDFFMRVVFHKVDYHLENLPNPKTINSETKSKKIKSYQRYRKEDIKKFPRNFLAIDRIKKELTDDVKEVSATAGLNRLGVIIAGLLFFSAFILEPLHTIWWEGPEQDNREQIENLKSQTIMQNKEIERLREDIDNLQKNLRTSEKSSSP